ncbi:MAG: DUF4091 domain-containing protein [Bdellovibrionota bacterium]
MVFSQVFRISFITITIAFSLLFASSAEADSKRSVKKVRNVAVRSFALINAKNGKTLKGYGNITKRVTIPLSVLAGKNLDIKVKTYPEKVGSVSFSYDKQCFRKIRNKQPYRLMQSDNGKYQKWKPVVKNYKIKAVPYSKRKGRGRKGRAKNINIRVVDAASRSDNVDPRPSPTALPTVTPQDELPFVENNNDFNIWVNEGGDKVVAEDLRYTRNGLGRVVNSVWNGHQVNLFAAKNETVSFNVIVEAAKRSLKDVSVKLDILSHQNGAEITGRDDAQCDDVFDYRGRNIEVFVVRYLKIKGLSQLGYQNYDERHIPQRLRRPHNAERGYGTWRDRPDHDASYPDIAVPQELESEVRIERESNQSFWVDIFVPKESPVGVYVGTIKVFEGDLLIHQIPVSLDVKNFTLPDTPSAKTMLYLGYSDISKRYIGQRWPYAQEKVKKLSQIRDRHFQMAHRHRISLIDSNEGGSVDAPAADWLPRLNGELFTAQNGYAGTGEGVGNGIFSIGTYGAWNWGDAYSMQQHANAWVQWFNLNAPTTDYFLYLIDEVADYPKITAWAETLNNNTGIGRALKSFATVAANQAVTAAPALDIACSNIGIGIPESWEVAADYYRNTVGKQFCFYNGHRPQSGSFMTEDDGVALRQLAWAQFKMGIDRWFYWESTYYNNFQGGTGETNVFQQAQTFGGRAKADPILGENGWNYSNGDGVLFYPGSDTVYPEESYGVSGPLASLRLKHWRRGIQDVDYLTLAAAKDPRGVKRIVQRIIPKVLWEYGVNDPSDPTWVLSDISWSTDPDVWEGARRELAAIIER